MIELITTSIETEMFVVLYLYFSGSNISLGEGGRESLLYFHYVRKEAANRNGMMVESRSSARTICL